MTAGEQGHEQEVDDPFVTDDDTPDLRAQAAARVRRALEQERVTADDWRKSCQGTAFVLQACPMREAAEPPHAPSGREGVVERPPPGLARGIFAVSPLVVTLVTTLLLFLSLGYYTLRLLKLRHR
jgi:hypothetical protein